MGKPSTTEVFTDSQLHQYIKEVTPFDSHLTQLITGLLCWCMTDYGDCSVPCTRLSLWQRQSTTVWWRKYRAQRWEREVSVFFPSNAPSYLFICVPTKNLNCIFINVRNSVICILISTTVRDSNYCVALTAPCILPDGHCEGSKRNPRKRCQWWVILIIAILLWHLNHLFMVTPPALRVFSNKWLQL